MTLHESDVERALGILQYICDEGGPACYEGSCPLHEMCRGYMQDDDASPFSVLDDPDTTENMIKVLEDYGLLKG